MRFHDLRHTYAVNSLKAGDDIKTLQENLGHATAAFTLSTYAHATPNMKVYRVLLNVTIPSIVESLKRIVIPLVAMDLHQSQGDLLL